MEFLGKIPAPALIMIGVIASVLLLIFFSALVGSIRNCVRSKRDSRVPQVQKVQIKINQKGDSNE